MKTRKNHILFHSIVLVLLSLALLVTCKAGLGESVDTKPPTITVSYPPNKSIIRDWFYIGGVADDETYVKEVTVLFKGLDSLKDQVFGPYKADVNKEKKQWSLKANDPSGGKFPILDGSYEVTIVGTDSAGRKTEVKAVYTIDNTPPLVVVSRPSTSGKVFDSFGDTVFFKGDYWDENTCSALEVVLYNTDNQKIASHRQTGIYSGWDFELPSSEFNKLKAGMTESSKPKNFYYTLTGYDNALVYQDSALTKVTNNNGNATNNVYIGSDLSSLYGLEDALSLEQISNLSVGKATSYKTGSTTISRADLLSKAKKSQNVSNTSGSFSIDPFNKNPNVSISGFTWYGKDFTTSYTENQVGGGSTVNITIEMGKSEKDINPETIKVTLYKEDGETIISEPKPSSIKSSGNNKNFDYTIDMTSGKGILEVYAEDYGGYTTTRTDTNSSYYKDGQYARYAFTINGAMPSITEVLPDTQKVHPVDGKFNASIKATDIDSTVVWLSIKKDGGVITGEKGIKLEGTLKNDSYSFSWDGELDAAEENGTTIYDFELYDGRFKSPVFTRTYKTDTVSPTISKITHPAKSDDSSLDELKKKVVFISGTGVTVKGLVDDDDLFEAKFIALKDYTEGSDIADDAGWVAGSVSTSEKAFSTNITLTDEEGGDEGVYTLFVRLADDTAVFGAPIQICKVSADKEPPTLGVTAGGVTDSKLVYKNEAVAFTVNASDTNGLEEIIIEVDGVEKYKKTIEEVNRKDTFEHIFRLEADKDKVYSILFTAKDVADGITTVERNIMIDTKSPTLEITAPTSGEGVGSDSYTIRGTVDDGEGKGVSSIQYSIDSTDGTDGNWTPISKAAAWSATGVDFSGGEQGKKTLWVRASDGLNTVTTKSVSFQYDTEDPVLIEGTSTLGEALVNRNTSVSFGGTASDTNKLESVTVSVNGGTATAVTGTTNWSYNLPANTDHSDDGTYALVFTATDVAGRTKSVKRNVLIDTTKPSTPAFTTSAGSYVTDSLAIAGTSSDAGSGIATAYYRVNGSTEDPKTGDLTGTDNWFATINIGSSGLNLGEGAHKVYVWTVDRAGNVSIDEAHQDFIVDRANPTISSDALASQATNKDITISGSASDSYKMASENAVTVTVSKDGGSRNTVTPTITNQVDDACDWSIAVNTLTDPLESGTYVYTITATDSVGRTASISRTVIIDVDAPTVTDLNLENNFLIRNDSYNVTGKATDNGGTGVAKVQYSLDNGATWMDATGTDSWVVALSGLEDGASKTFAVRATDNAGNITDPVVNRTYKVDLYNPTFTETTSTITGTALAYRNADVAFGGVVSDANGIESVTVKVNNGDPQTITFTSADSEPAETWSWTLEANTTTHENDGTYELVFTAEDKNRRTTSFTRNVMIDTTAPTVVITSPAENEAVDTESYTIRGTANDGDGSGVKSIQYSEKDPKGEDFNEESDWTTIKKAFSWSEEITLLDEGPKSIWVRASDGLNTSDAVKRNFFYDEAPPVLKEENSGLGEALVNRKTAVNFGGTASDTNALASVTVSVNGIIQSPSITVNEDGEWSWELSNTTDGTYALVFTATDEAGKTASVKRNVLIDTTKPTLNVNPISTNWYTNATREVTGTVTENGSGLAKVEYQTRTSSSAEWSAPQNFALNGNNFSGMVQFSDGATNEICIWATDLAGNVSTIANQTGIQVDTIAPSFDITSPTSIPLSNGSGSLSISIKAIDVTSGAKTVYAKVGDTNWDSGTIIDSDGEATVEISSESFRGLSDGNQRIYLRVDDKAGHSSAVTSQIILIDKTPPTVNFSEPANSAKVNKTISLAGTANDTNGLGSTGVVEREISTDNWETVTGAVFSITGTNWTVSGFDTTKYADNSTIKIRVGIKDAAGNMGYAERSLSINQDGDRPVVRLTNVRPDGKTTLLNSSIVSGILLDDDGTVPLSGFEISEDGSDWKEATASVVNDPETLFYDVDTRSFQYAPSSDDGEKTLYFRITDAAGTIFETPISYTSEQLSYPKAQYSTDVSTATGKAIKFKVDTNPPDIDGDIHFDITSPYTFDGDGAVGDDYRLLNNTLFGGGSGGSKSKFALRIKAKDAVGIASAILTIGSEEFTMTSGTTDAEGWTIFTTSSTSPINVSEWSTGSYTVKLDVTDKSGQKSTSTREILVDNAAPTVEIISHNMNEQVTGDLIFRGTAQDVGSAGLDKVEYQVGNSTWKDVGRSFAWNIDFTKSNVITTTDSYANTDHATETPAGSNIWRLPIKIRVTDKAGNQYIHTHSLDIDPDGDKPIVSVLYPETGSTLGGTVRIFGSATDNVRVDKVWMMIDVDGGGVYDQEDADYLNDLYDPDDPDSVKYEVEYKDGAYQFAVDGTASWNKSINTKGEFNPKDGGSKRIRFRVRAQDNNGTYGSWSEDYEIFFDNKVPQIGSTNPLKLVQYSNSDGTGDIIAERDYIANMYIRGEWYLTGSVRDESGIQAISLTGSAEASLSGSNSSWFVQDGDAVSETGKYNYQLKIPVGKSLTNETAGLLNYVIKVEDASTPASSATANILINYDNKAPMAAPIEHGGLVISETNLITNSNRGFSMNSTVTEADSGFERLAFFFVRRGTQDRVYNPMYSDTNNRTDISALTWTEGDIPRLDVSDLTRDSEDSLQSGELINNENIRVGGLVRIAGIDRVIQSVYYDTGTVTFSPAVSQDHKTAEFAYAQIVNNMLVETGNWEGNVLKTISNDDGDGMIEAVERSGGSYHWTATIDSKNIPDGPIELHYVAYDKAGNSVAGSVTSFVSNNRPRLAKVSLGTDLSGDGQFTSNEIVKYYEALSGEEESLVNLASQDFIVKAKLAIFPEFVGGNGTLGYTWTTNGNADDEWTGGSIPKDALAGTVKSFTNIAIDGSGSHSAIVIESSELTTTMDDKLKLFSFGIWDETEETMQGSTSQWARLNAPMLVDVVDGVAPKVVIRPFFWNSATDNSLYGNSKTNGHIELEADLPNPPFSGSSGLFDRDPKVSGQISIRGTAYDDVRLSALYVHFGDGTDSRFDFGTTETKTVDRRIYSRVATYSSSTGWTGTDEWAENGWKFTVIDTDDSVYLDQRGHLVKWQLDIDTSKISGVARLDQLLRIVAEDARPNASSEATSGIDTRDDVTENNVPSYQMDVVPYITKIGTMIGEFSGDEFARSASGAYSVYEGEKIDVYGLNLTGASAVTVGGTALESLTPGTGYVSATIGSSISSKGLTVTVNGIESLNNVNNNPVFAEDGQTITKYEYNSQANSLNNNRLNDDVNLYVWSMGYFINSTNITSPVMKMGPDSRFYMSYGKGVPEMVINKNGAETRVDYSYNKFHNTNVAFDTDGNAYAVATNTDRVNDSSAKFVFYQRSSTNVRLEAPDYQYPSNLKRHLETAYNSSTGVYDINRVKIPKLTITGSANNAKVFLSYFDANHSKKSVKFRYGTITGDTTVNGGVAGNTNGTTQNDNPAFNSGSAKGFHIVANDDSIYKGGAYTAVGTTSTGVAVVAWYDASARRLVYSYNESPDTAVVGGAWQTNAKVIDSSYAGWYVDMTVDANNGIHIAYYNSAKGDLKYAYLPSYDCAAEDIKVVTVDSYLSVGTQITINTRAETIGGTTRQVPYISYFYSSFTQTPTSIRVAWRTDWNELRDGAINDVYTGAWEAMTIPTENIPTDGIVCNGVPTSGAYGNQVVLGYMSDAKYEKAVLKK